MNGSVTSPGDSAVRRQCEDAFRAAGLIVADPETSYATNRYANAAGQTVLSYLLVASGSWAAIWPLFGGVVQVFAGISIVNVVVWLLNWDGTKEVLSLAVGAGFVLTMSLSGLGYLALSNLRSKLLNPAWLADATVAQIASVIIQVGAVTVIGILAFEILRVAATTVFDGSGSLSIVREPGD